MARTTLLSANALTQEHWPQTFFEYMLENMQLSKFMGVGSDSVIQIDKTLSKAAGDKITLELDMPLEEVGGYDDSDIEGNEEAMSFYNMPITIHERSHGVRSNGKMTDKRTAIDIMRKATMALGRWSAAQLDNDLLWALSGLGNQGTYVGEGTSTIETVNECAPSANRIWHGGQTNAGVVTEVDTCSAISSNGSNYQFGSQVISVLKRKAQLARPKFRPVWIGGKAYLIALIHPLQTKSLRAETGANGWNQIQQNADIRGLQNKLFTREGEGRDRMFDGIVAIIDDVIIYEYDRIETRVAGEVFDSGDTLDAHIAPGTYRMARGLLLGAQAGVVAWGQMWKRYTENFDYNRKPGVATDAIYGVRKSQFRDPGANQSTNTAQEDYATIAFDTVVVED